MSSAAPVEAVGVRHVFGGDQAALERIDLSITAGQFWTLLGPSGSGKTTLLRIFAGLVSPTEGRVNIGGRDVTDVPVQQREIGFVFQNYALFPHQTVAENVAFPLGVRGMKRRERVRKVEEALELVELSGMKDRYPGQLSGGQQQRVAIARALVFDPKVLLLDEPLGALDLRLRQQLGSDLRRIQQQAGTTAIYVTHDQSEAFLLSDVVVVMNQGEVHQIGSPAEVYGQPADEFVARFLGETNILSGVVKRVASERVTLLIDGVEVECARETELEIGSESACSIRPENVEIYGVGDGERPPDGRCVFGQATVEEVVFLGSRSRVALDVRGRRFLVELNREAAARRPGDRCIVAWRPGAPFAIGRPRA